MLCCLSRLGLSPGAHGGIRGTGTLGITESHGTETHGTADDGGTRGTGIRGTGTLGIITGHTGAMTRIGITIITTITREYGITAGMDEMFTTARGIRQALSAPEALQWAGAEVRPDLRCPGIWLQEHPAVQQCPGALHQV